MFIVYSLLVLNILISIFGFFFALKKIKDHMLPDKEEDWSDPAMETSFIEPLTNKQKFELSETIDDLLKPNNNV